MVRCNYTMETINTVLFSDVHLGSPVSRAYELLQLLKEYKFKKLIIAGDMFEDLNFKYLTSTQWELLEHIGKISRRGVEVIWLQGNHDASFCVLVSHLIGILVRDEYQWRVGGRRFLVLHGHQFDRFMSKNIFIGRLLALVYSRFQRFMSSHFFDYLFVRFSDRWLRLTEDVADEALKYAKKKRADVVICGHTHFKYNEKKDGREYFNLGSWNNKPSYLLLIDDTGKAYFKVLL